MTVFLFFLFLAIADVLIASLLGIIGGCIVRLRNKLSCRWPLLWDERLAGKRPCWSRCIGLSWQARERSARHSGLGHWQTWRAHEALPCQDGGLG
jgi:hypothetical protein